MENKFADEIKNILNGTSEYSRTENDGLQYRSTNSALLDLFATIGAMREKNETEIVDAFSKASVEDELLAMKMLFYARNIRGGLGERRTFRVILKNLGAFPKLIEKNIELVPDFGRWDDLFVLFDTNSEKIMLDFVTKQFKKDLLDYRAGNFKNISLLAKWMPSINASSKETVALAKKFVKALGTKDKYYRKALSELRTQLRIVEKAMSSNAWDEINYQGVPSYAMKNYASAFGRHDYERFSSYIEQVKSGEKTINAGTLFPYDLVKKYSNTSWVGNWKTIEQPVVEIQWKALPNYIDGNKNIMIMADTSGSMYNEISIYASLGLGIYFAERNHGAFHNLMMVFAGDPALVQLTEGASLVKKLSEIPAIVASNTDIGKAFNKVLEIGITGKVSPEDMPEALLVITDMEFDPSEVIGKTAYETAQKNFARYGYKLPRVIFWNVSQRTSGYQAKKDDKGVIMVSGTSASTFKEVLAHIDMTPYEFMLKVLSNPIYDRVRV